MVVTEGAAEVGLDGIKNKINPGDPIEENIYEMNFRRITGAGIDTVEWGAYRVQVHQLELIGICDCCDPPASEIVSLLAVLRLIESDVLLAYSDLESQRLIQNKADPYRADNCVRHRNRGSFELQEELVWIARE